MIFDEIKGKDLKKFCVKSTDTIFNVINQINNNKNQFVVVLEKNKFIGIITDGDIRRSILKKVNLNEICLNIVNKSPIFVKFNKLKELNFDEIKNILTTKKIDQIPVIKNNQIYSLVLNKRDINQNLAAFIFSGGKGTRLLPLTKNTPKGMIKINNVPMLERLIYQLKDNGIRKIYISVNHLKEKIKKYFKNGSKFGLDIIYIEENRPLGTCGSLSLLKDKMYEHFVIINCDVYFSFDLRELFYFHKKNSFDFTICSKKINYKIDHGVLTLKKNYIIDFKEKPIFKFDVNTGIYLINRNLFKYIPKNKIYDMNSFINKMIKKDNINIGAYEIFSDWTDIGKISDFNKLNDEI